MVNHVTGAVIMEWTPGDMGANLPLWAALDRHQVVDIMADVLTYIASELGLVDSRPGSYVESAWMSQMSDNIGKGVLSMIHCWEECDDPLPHLIENVRILSMADFVQGGNLIEQVLCCMFDLAGSLRDGNAKLAVLDDDGVRVVR